MNFEKAALLLHICKESRPYPTLKPMHDAAMEGLVLIQAEATIKLPPTPMAPPPETVTTPLPPVRVPMPPVPVHQEPIHPLEPVGLEEEELNEEPNHARR